MKNLNITNRILKALLLKYSIDGEEILYEGEENVICEKSNITEETKVTFFITGHRIGYVTEKAAYYFTSTNYLRDFSFDKDNKKFTIYLTDADKANNIEKDYILYIINSNNDEQILKKLSTIYVYRYNNPMECTYPIIDNVIHLLYEYKFEEALEELKKISNLDYLTGVPKLLQIKICKMMGNPQKATLILAQNFEDFSAYSLSTVISEIMRYDWSKEVLNYLPSISSVDDIDRCLLNFIYADIKGNKEDVLNESNNLMKALVKDSDLHAAMVVALKSLMMNAEFHNKSKSFDEIYNLAVKLMKLKLMKLEVDKEKEKEECEYVISLLDGMKNDPIKIIKEDSPQTFKLLYENNFSQLLNLQFEKEEVQKLACYDMDSIESYELTDSYVDVCEYEIFKLFAELRSNECRPQDLLVKFKELDKLLDEQNRRIFANSDELLEILYYIIACEIYILNERKRDCLKIIVKFRKKIKKCSGLDIHEIKIYREEIADFYEALALGSFYQIKKCDEKIPKENLLWLHTLYENNCNLRKFVESEDEALNLLNNVIVRFKSISKNEGIINEENRDKIMDSVHKIEDKLEEDELRITVVGETSAGKTTFLNTLFNTDLFFSTQEEATGVATEIRKGDKIEIEVLDKENNIRSAYNTKKGSWFNKIVDNKDDNLSIKKSFFNKLIVKSEDTSPKEELEGISAAQFIAKNTKVGEEALEWVYKVKVKLPIKELPDNVVIVDTPGFNANDIRTQIAKREISNAHVCLFLIDARNALKKNEMEILNLVEDESGKVFFILNKMDSVTYDEDLDDDMNADEGIMKVGKELTNRVKSEIKKHLQIENVEVYPVSSIYKESYEEKIKDYYYNVQKLKDNIFDESNDRKLDLLINMAAKEAIKVSEIIIKIGQESIEKLEEEEESLTEKLPSDPQLFKNLIENRVLDKFHKLKGNYIDKIEEIIDTKIEIAKDKYYNWLQEVDSKNELKHNAQTKAEIILSEAMDDVEKIKTEELSIISDEILNEIIVVFEELYSDLSFKGSFKSEDLMKYTSSLNLKENQINSIRNIKGEISANVKGGIIGASIGLVFGPLGAVIGGFIGTKFGGGDISEMKEQILDAYNKAIIETNNAIIDSCNQDLKSDDNSSFFGKFIDVIDEQIIKYEGMIKNKILVTNNYLNEQNNLIFIFKEKAYRINDDIEALKNWRKFRG